MVLKTVYLCIIVFSMVKTKNYQNGTIYQVVDIAYEQCYFGSTIDTLPNRFKGHKKPYQHYLNGNKRKYTSLFDMFDKFGIENCKIELVENYVCSSIAELHKREGYYIKNNDCINKNISGRSAKERYNDNSEPYKEKSKNYYQNNKNGRIKEYNDNKREHLCEIKRSNYHSKKTYYQEQQKEYQKNNADKIYERKSKKITCDCGCIISYGYKAQHFRTKKHQDWFNEQNEE